MDLIPDGEIPCPRCGKMFSNLAKLKIHTSEHAGPKQKFECFVCGKAYRSQELFEEHFDVHLKSDSGECDVCQEKFETVKELRLHKLTHVKKKDPEASVSTFNCLVCDEGFDIFDAFKQHQSSHAKPYEKFKCNSCGLCFAEEECLKTHMVQCKYEKLVQGHDISKAQRNTKCPYCKKFLKTVNLKRHVKMYCNPRKEARKVFFCKTCGKLYTSVISLRRHIKFYCKDIECKFCDKRFSNEEYLLAHLGSCKVLKLREQLQRVRDEGKYKCQICDETFAKRKLLLEHRRLHYRSSRPKRLTMLTFCAPATTVVANNNVFLPTYFNIVNGPDGKPVLAPMSNQIMILNPSQMMRNENGLLTPKIEPAEVEETQEVYTEGNIPQTADVDDDEMEEDGKEIVLYDDSAEVNPDINLEPIVELQEGTEPYEEVHMERPPPSPESSDLVIAESDSPAKKKLHECDMCEQTFTNRSALEKHYLKHEMDMLENLKNVTYGESASVLLMGGT